MPSFTELSVLLAALDIGEGGKRDDGGVGVTAPEGVAGLLGVEVTETTEGG